MTQRQAVAYYRVSTQKQGQSGLGLEAQQAAVRSFCQQRGLTLLHQFIEVESGSCKQRPELTLALKAAQQSDATLLVAKLDRLSRSLGLICDLQDSKQKFIAVDNPEATELTVHILAAVAQAERKAISDRTRAALQAAKARGTPLGNPNGAAALRRAAVSGPQARRATAQAHAERLRALLTPMRGMTLRAIADALNEANVATPKGKRWYANSVRTVLNRL